MKALSPLMLLLFVWPVVLPGEDFPTLKLAYETAQTKWVILDKSAKEKRKAVESSNRSNCRILQKSLKDSTTDATNGLKIYVSALRRYYDAHAGVLKSDLQDLEGAIKAKLEWKRTIRDNLSTMRTHQQSEFDMMQNSLEGLEGQGQLKKELEGIMNDMRSAQVDVEEVIAMTGKMDVSVGNFEASIVLIKSKLDRSAAIPSLIERYHAMVYEEIKGWAATHCFSLSN